MNILIIDPADFVGGAELFTVDLMLHLPSKGYNIVVATNGHTEYLAKINAQKIVIEKVVLKRLKSGGISTIKNLIALRKSVAEITALIKKHSINLVQTNSIRAHIIGALAVRKTKTPLLWIVHDFTFPHFFARLLAQYPEKIVTCSYAVKHDLEQKISQKHASKLCVIPSGIDLEAIEKISQAPNLRQKLGLKNDAILIGHVGRIDRWKGQEHLIHAVKRVITSISNAHFILIGDASAYDPTTIAYKTTLQSLVTELNLTSHVTFLGWQASPLAFIKQLNLFVHTSTDPEPFGRVILEAMACQVPVIVSNRGGGPTEIITHQQNGIILDPNDHNNFALAIIKLLQEPKLTEKYVENARKTIQKRYSIDKTLAGLKTLYKNILHEDES